MAGVLGIHEPGQRDVYVPDAGPSGLALALLDTGYLRSQIPKILGRSDRRSEDKAKEKKAAAQAKKRKFHARLVALMGRMGAGEFGWLGEKVADKWLHDILKCPGIVRRHGICGQDSFEPLSCQFQLCPWCQARVAKRRAKQIGPHVARFAAPKLWTFTGGPNQEELTGAVIAAVQGAVVAMHRRSYIKARCRGGFRKIEIANTGNGWNVHCHELADADWVSPWPLWDLKWEAKPYWEVVEKAFPVCDMESQKVSWKRWVIRRRPGRWVVVNKHPGLAVLFTESCQKFPELAADGVKFNGFPVFAEDNPASWFMVDVRVANYSPENEISKYIAKGNEIVEAGGRAVLDYLQAIKGKQLFKGFGHCYNVDLEAEEEETEGPEAALKGCCPYEDCPHPEVVAWTFQYGGFPDAGQWELERNPKTGTHRLIPIGKGGAIT